MRKASLTQPLISRPAYGYVYLLTNVVNGKKYVGCTKVSIAQRLRQHRSAARKGSPFAIHAALRKYGFDAFQVETIEYTQGGYTDLLEAEKKHIAAEGSTSPFGYNLTEGGEGADYLVPGVRERHAEAMRALANDPKWRAALIVGVRKRSADPVARKAQVEGARRHGESKRSKTCTLCRVALLEAVPRKSWCKACTTDYNRRYRQRQQEMKVGV